MLATTESPGAAETTRRGERPRRRRFWGLAPRRNRLSYQRARLAQNVGPQWPALVLALGGIGGGLGGIAALYLHRLLSTHPGTGSGQVTIPVLIFLGSLLLGLLLFAVTWSNARWRVLSQEMKSEHREALRTARFLADTTLLLASSVSPKLLEQLAHRAVPLLGRGCAIALLDEEGAHLQVTVVHECPEKERALRAIYGNLVPVLGVEKVLREVAVPRVRRLPPRIQEQLLLSSLPEEQRALAAELLRDIISVPIMARGKPLGLLIVDRWPDRRYGPREFSPIYGLAMRVGLAVDNTRLLGDAQRAIRIREDFLSIASHELRTPLTALQANLQGLLRMLRAETPIPLERQVRSLEASERQANRLSKLVNQLLDVSRITAGRMAPERDTLDLAALIEDMVERYQFEASRSGSALEIDVSSVVGYWDRDQLEQIFINLLSNAIKYGEGKPIRVSLELCRDDEWVRLQVRDHGQGISEEAKHRIFDRFERASSGGHQAGLGLGLFIVRTLVEAHGGTIRVDGEVGKGSCFTVELPRRPPAAPDAGEPPVREPAPSERTA